MKDLKHYVFYSVLGHLIALLFAAIFSSFHNTDGKFIVFGAYSRKPTKTIWKNNTIPFLNGPSSHKRKGFGSGRGNHGDSQKGSHKKQVNNRGKQAAKTNKKPMKKTTQPKQKTRTEKKHQNKLAPKNKKALIEPVSVKKRQKKLLTSAKLSNKLVKSNSNAIAVAKEKKDHKAPAKKQASTKTIKKIEKKPTAIAKKQKIELPHVQENEIQEISVDKKTKKKQEDIAQKQTALVQETEVEEDGNDEEQGDASGEPDGNVGFNFVGAGTSNENIVIFQKHIQQEVDRLWHPPLGVPKGTVCTIYFDIDPHGKIKECSLVKRSPVLIYDLSIMRVVKKFKFHEYLWGKKFKIDFRQ